MRSFQELKSINFFPTVIVCCLLKRKRISVTGDYQAVNDPDPRLAPRRGAEIGASRLTPRAPRIPYKSTDSHDIGTPSPLLQTRSLVLQHQLGSAT